MIGVCKLASIFLCVVRTESPLCYPIVKHCIVTYLTANNSCTRKTVQLKDLGTPLYATLCEGSSNQWESRF